MSTTEFESDITDKRGIAIEYKVSTRTICNLMTRGMPHIKINRRLSRFSREQVRKWMLEQFGTRRYGKESK